MAETGLSELWNCLYANQHFLNIYKMKLTCFDVYYYHLPTFRQLTILKHDSVTIKCYHKYFIVTNNIKQDTKL